MPVSMTAAAVNLAAAVLFGGVIGAERQLRQRTAGLRTNALVALGAASFVLFAATFDKDVSPTRVAAQIVSGIGFLGAGIIYRDGFSISGINTAATLWCAAAIGMLAGHGQIAFAALVTGFVVLVNFGFRPLSTLLKQAAKTASGVNGFEVTVVCRPDQDVQVRSLIVQGFAVAGMHLTELGSSEADMEGRTAIRAVVTGGSGGQAAIETVAGRLSLDPAVVSVRWGINEAD